MPVTFNRALGLFDATLLVVGAIVGADIFVNPYLVAQRLDGFALVLLAWVVGEVIALLGSLSYAELGALRPHAGGHAPRDRHPVVGTP
jgi:APA family basic amino acid/polyamine antiporter